MPVVVVFGERESDEALAVRTRGEGQSTQSLEELLADLADVATARRPSSAPDTASHRPVRCTLLRLAPAK